MALKSSEEDGKWFTGMENEISLLNVAMLIALDTLNPSICLMQDLLGDAVEEILSRRIIVISPGISPKQYEMC